MNIFEQIKTQNEANLFIAATGAGSGLQTAAFKIPGASSYLVGAVFPYSTREFDKFIGHKPEKYCSEEAAIELAMAAFIRAKRDCAHDLSVKPKKSIGLGLSCAVTTDRARKGSNRVHAAVVSDYGCFVLEEVLDDKTNKMSPLTPEEQRSEDDENATLTGCRLLNYALTKYNPFEAKEISEETLMGLILKNPYFLASGKRSDKLNRIVPLIYPGSFNPAHPGHLATALAGERALDTYYNNLKAVPSITIDHPDKPTATAVDVLTRIAYLKEQMPDHDVRISRGDALFVEKAERFPNSYMLVGSDTLKRMGDPKYGYTVTQVDDILNKNEVDLICVPRSKEDLLLSEQYGTTVTAEWSNKVSPSISSTQIRENWSKQ